MTIDELKDAANSLPLEPGVYLMHDAQDTVIYVGKAKKLKNRVSQYFQDTASHNLKTRKMVSQVDHFETIAARSEFEALVLECSLIKHYMPKYNILLKDDKGYPFLRIDLKESYPTITLAGKLKDDGASYFGPYGSRGRSAQVIDTLRATFRLNDCSKKFPRDINKERPCLNFQMNKCDGWCRSEMTQEEYRNRIRQIILLLQGKHQNLCENLRRQMEEAAENLQFEHAAELRDRVRSIEMLGEKQLVTAGSLADTDYIGWFQTEAKACFAVLHFIKGNLMDKDFEILPFTYDAAEAMSSLLKQYYLTRETAPRRIFIPMPMEDAELFGQMLEQRLNKKVTIQVPQRGDNRQLSDLANKNAKEEAERVTSATERINGTLALLKNMLKLPEIPKRMEAFDISHIAGTDIVASMVVFVDGKPKKSEYKRFKLENMENQDDYFAMRQVVFRRFNHYLDGDKGFNERPDVLLIDGGEVHARVILELMQALNLNIPIFGMVKDDRHRTRALLTPDGHEIAIDSNTAVFSMIGNIQEETHRFAITYHKELRSKRLSGSSLDQISGIGEKRKIQLLKQFKTIGAIKQATEDELRKVVPANVAKSIYNFYRKQEQK